MTTLQRFLFPSVDLCSESEMYVHCTSGSWCSLAKPEVRLLLGSSARFDTYFNAFSVGKWRRHTAVDQVTLRFEASGEVEARAVLNHAERASRVVAAGSFSSEDRSWFELTPPPLEDLGDGQLYLEVRCVGEEATVFDGCVTTGVDPVRDVRLGVVITTYNRPEYLERNLTRLAGALKDVPGYAERLEVVVVDNARNVDLTLPATAPITVVPNRNLGGAGGFARGLIGLRDAGSVTHVLFMDDDITFDPEIIFRTLELLAHARDPELCLAGAMLREEAQHVQFEAGAAFLNEKINPIRPIGSHVDLRDWRNLVDNEIERSAGYGAWWYFAFPIQVAEVNPLPVFVRGDDICFGLRHAGRHTITLNGIGVWHQSFAQKNGPAAFYYEARNFPLLSVLVSDNYEAKHLVRRFLYHTTRMLLAMRYDTAAADIAGLRQFLEGPEAWMALDHEQVNRDIRQHQGERPGPLDRNQRAVRKFEPRRLIPKIGGLFSSILLSGHILPRRLNRRPPVALALDDWSPFGVFGREEVVYRYEPTGEGYVARRDRQRFFALFGEMLKTATIIPRRFDRLKEEYRAAYPRLTGDAYWRKQFSQTDVPVSSDR